MKFLKLNALSWQKEHFPDSKRAFISLKKGVSLLKKGRFHKEKRAWSKIFSAVGFSAGLAPASLPLLLTIIRLQFRILEMVCGRFVYTSRRHSFPQCKANLSWLLKLIKITTNIHRGENGAGAEISFLSCICNSRRFFITPITFRPLPSM